MDVQRVALPDGTERYLPNYLFGLVPESLWPDSPRDYYVMQLNQLPINAGQLLTQSVSFNKRLWALVFGASGVVTTVNNQDGTIVNPLGGTSMEMFVTLACPAAQEQFTSGAVPWENLFGNSLPPALNPLLWPVPMVIQPGANLQMTLQSVLGVNVNVRIAFHLALVKRRTRKAA